jgi:uncharacterized membrane protein
MKSLIITLVCFFFLCLLRAEDHTQLQLVEREDIDDEEDLFEAIDKCMTCNLRLGSLILDFPCVFALISCFLLDIQFVQKI